jgi:hypothetical protein
MQKPCFRIRLLVHGEWVGRSLNGRGDWQRYCIRRGGVGTDANFTQTYRNVISPQPGRP